jgi:4-hydroxythreonine-4-phosphate dehydrogenase
VGEAAPGSLIRIGLTLGDPRGIGPEVAAAAARAYRAAAPHQLIFIGPTGTAAGGAGDEHVVTGEWRNSGRNEAGRHAGLAIDEAIRLALQGDIDAIVTAPIDKAALHAAGFPFPGHTEMLASRTGTRDVVMLMAAERTLLGGPLRVVLATTHIPLAQVPIALTADRIIDQVRVTGGALREGWGMPDPRIALCAFNPHASDGGLFGDEETRVYAPAIAALRADGFTISEPLPADTVFRRAASGQFDVVIAPYHDVGMAAFKTVAFGAGVNVTLGLPFPRTSPDHGTAFDIAGRGAADPSSMLEAIMLAARLGIIQQHKRIATGS